MTDLCDAFNNEQVQSDLGKNEYIEETKIFIGSYEIIKKLKEGNHSRIYLGISKYTNENVAIKVINKSQFKDNLDNIIKITEMIEILKLVKHRNILSLYEIYESPNYYYLITEYFSGRDLIEKIINKKKFTEEEALLIFFQLLDAMIYLHKMKICHRNIKAEHILFDKYNRPKLISFSYSSFYNNKEKLKDAYGTLCYSCPEILIGEQYSPELADVWSLGVVLYVMVCGYLPFSEENEEKNKILISQGKVDYPREMSIKLKDLLKHMLDINPNKRYSFGKIIQHPWLKPYNEEMLSGGCNIYKMIYPIDKIILNMIGGYNLVKEKIEQDMKDNKYNLGTSIYKQLVRKLLDMKSKSKSDLCSKEFIKFREDKHNYYIDGDKRYDKFLNEVKEKIILKKNHLNECSQKEGNIFQHLFNIEFIQSNQSNEDREIIDDFEKNEKNIVEENNNCSLAYIKYKNYNRKQTPKFYLNSNNKNQNIYNKSKGVDVRYFNKKRNKEIQISTISEEKSDKKIPKSSSAPYLGSDGGQNIIQKINTAKVITPFNRKYSKRLFITDIYPNGRSNSMIINNNQKAISENDIEIENVNGNEEVANRITSLQKNRPKKEGFSIETNNEIYLDKASFMDDFLKKNHPNNIRNTIFNNEAINNEKQKEIENNFKNKRNDIFRNEYLLKSNKMLRSSFSFRDEDNGNEDENDSLLSKFDSKILAFFETNEEIKELKDLINKNKQKRININKEKIKKESTNYNYSENCRNGKINFNNKSSFNIDYNNDDNINLNNNNNINNTGKFNIQNVKINNSNNNILDYKDNIINNIILNSMNNGKCTDENNTLNSNDNDNPYNSYRSGKFSQLDKNEYEHIKFKSQLELSFKDQTLDKYNNNLHEDILIYTNDKKTLNHLNYNINEVKDMNIINLGINSIENHRQKENIYNTTYKTCDSNKMYKNNNEINIINVTTEENKKNEEKNDDKFCKVIQVNKLQPSPKKITGKNSSEKIRKRSIKKNKKRIIIEKNNTYEGSIDKKDKKSRTKANSISEVKDIFIEKQRGIIYKDIGEIKEKNLKSFFRENQKIILDEIEQKQLTSKTGKLKYYKIIKENDNKTNSILKNFHKNLTENNFNNGLKKINDIIELQEEFFIAPEYINNHRLCFKTLLITHETNINFSKLKTFKGLNKSKKFLEQLDPNDKFNSRMGSRNKINKRFIKTILDNKENIQASPENSILIPNNLYINNSGADAKNSLTDENDNDNDNHINKDKDNNNEVDDLYNNINTEKLDDLKNDEIIRKYLKKFPITSDNFYSPVSDENNIMNIKIDKNKNLNKDKDKDKDKDKNEKQQEKICNNNGGLCKVYIKSKRGMYSSFPNTVNNSKSNINALFDKPCKPLSPHLKEMEQQEGNLYKNNSKEMSNGLGFEELDDPINNKLMVSDSIKKSKDNFLEHSDIIEKIKCFKYTLTTSKKEKEKKHISNLNSAGLIEALSSPFSKRTSVIKVPIEDNRKGINFAKADSKLVQFKKSINLINEQNQKDNFLRFCLTNYNTFSLNNSSDRIYNETPNDSKVGNVTYNYKPNNIKGKSNSKNRRVIYTKLVMDKKFKQKEKEDLSNPLFTQSSRNKNLKKNIFSNNFNLDYSTINKSNLINPGNNKAMLHHSPITSKKNISFFNIRAKTDIEPIFPKNLNKEGKNIFDNDSNNLEYVYTKKSVKKRNSSEKGNQKKKSINQ